MKKKLLYLALLLWSGLGFSQTPHIEGDVLMCPWTNGTAYIVTDEVYDSYQWYWKYWFLPDDFAPVEGANEASFTYDWYTYDQAILKVVVTLDGQTFESNTIQIDSWNWVSMFLMYDLGEAATFDPNTESILLCQGGSFVASINNPPYNANIRWFRNDVLIEGATQSSYAIAEPGVYYASAAPDFCPDNTSNSLTLNVVWDTNCTLGVNNPAKDEITLFPNPVKDILNVNTTTNSFTSYQLTDLTGKTVAGGAVSSPETAIPLSQLSNGIYLIRLIGGENVTTLKIVKE